MAYNANIPQPTDQISQSQQDILNNFQAIQTLIGINHVNFGAADEGKHKWVTFPVQGSAPAFGGTEIGLYSKNYATTGRNELFVHQTVGTDTPCTANLGNTNGWTYLPSGILLKWGFVTSVLPNPYTVTYIGPAFTAVYSVLTSICTSPASDPNTAVAIYVPSIATTTGFQVQVFRRDSSGTATTAQFTYLAIGK